MTNSSVHRVEAVALAKRQARRLIRWLRRTSGINPPGLNADDFRRLVGKPDPVILDIGSNDGSQTALFLRIFPGAQVYAFEPDPRAAKRFRQNVSAPRASLLNVALSNQDGTAEFHLSGGTPPPAFRDKMPEGWDESGSLKPPKRHLEVYPWCSFGETATVQTMRLDTWFQAAGVGAIDFIWADVQGAEKELIEGGMLALSKTRFLYTEYSDNELYAGQVGLSAIQRLLPDFRIVHRWENNVLLRNIRVRPV